MQTSAFYQNNGVNQSPFSDEFTDIALIHSSENGYSEVYKAWNRIFGFNNCWLRNLR